MNVIQYINRMNGKSMSTSFIDAKNNLIELNTHTHTETLNKLGIEVNYLNIIKVINNKHKKYTKC